MERLRLTWVVGVSFLLCFSVACGDDPANPNPPDGQDAGIPVETVDAGAVNDGGDSSDAGVADDAGTSEDAGVPDDAGTAGDAGLVEPCATGLLCGEGACCDSGEACLDGACVAACASGVRCGDSNATCCNTGELCIEGACAAPTASCLDWTDCADGERCERVTAGCVPLGAGAMQCSHAPQRGSPGDRAIEWQWLVGGFSDPDFVLSAVTPLVVDLDGDGFPEVVVVAFAPNSAGAARLRALDGRTGVEIWVAGSTPGQVVDQRVTPAAADLDGDGRVEIVAGRHGGGLLAFEHDGTFKWNSTASDGTTPWIGDLASGAVTIADFEGDGTPEIVVGGRVFEASGRLRFDKGAAFGSNGSYGAVSAVADLDGAPPLELVGGRFAYRADGTEYWDNGLGEGYPAGADLEGDGHPEVVVAFNGTVRVQDGRTGESRASFALSGGAGGPPLVADFDGDGTLEIAVANGMALVVLEYTPGTPAELTEKWQKPVMDMASARAGASAFDFDGDGAAELLYADECFLYVFAGADGAELMREPRTSATYLEYPVVADVDGDGAAEIIVVANDNSSAISCPYPPQEQTRGVTVYGGDPAPWAPTRRIWNQYAYHLNRVREDGAIASTTRSAPERVGDRQSHAGLDTSAAPDLAVSLDSSLGGCPSAVELRAHVRNQGSGGVPPGVSVRFFAGSGENRVELASATTTKTLGPGASETLTWSHGIVEGEGPLSFSAAVDVDDQGQGSVAECREDNGEAMLTGVDCRLAP